MSRAAPFSPPSLRELSNVVYRGEVSPARETDPGKLVHFVVTEEANGFLLWLGLADELTSEERGVEYVPAGEGWIAGRDAAIEAAVTRTLRARGQVKS
jgi:hypothetical protein